MLIFEHKVDLRWAGTKYTWGQRWIIDLVLQSHCGGGWLLGVVATRSLVLGGHQQWRKHQVDEGFLLGLAGPGNSSSSSISQQVLRGQKDWGSPVKLCSGKAQGVDEIYSEMLMALDKFELSGWHVFSFWFPFFKRGNQRVDLEKAYNSVPHGYLAGDAAGILAIEAPHFHITKHILSVWWILQRLSLVIMSSSVCEFYSGECPALVFLPMMWFCWLHQPITSTMQWGGLYPCQRVMIMLLCHKPVNMPLCVGNEWLLQVSRVQVSQGLGHKWG